MKTSKISVVLVLLAVACCLPVTGLGQVRLPRLFQDGMVLQRGQEIAVWGWASPGQQVSVSLNRHQATATAAADGRWRVALPAMKAGGPYTLQAGDLTVSDVLIGDVWLCSGQSNIDVTVERVYPQYTTDIDRYENPNIRLFRVQNDTDTHGPKSDIRPTGVNWKPVSKQTAWGFSAVGYFLGRYMYEKTGVPQGIIVNSWGGTPIEAWLPADSLRSDFSMLVARTQMLESDDYVKAQQRANQLADQRWHQLLDSQEATVEAPQGQSAFLFAQPGYDDSGWASVDQFAPSIVPTQGSGGRGSRSFVGSLWLRQHVTIDSQHAGKPARLLLGTLFDCDYTFVNGQEVGRTYYQYPPRRYDIPEGLLRQGDNVIAVRFVNKQGTPHFIKEKPYLLAFGDDRQSQNPMPNDVVRLSTSWKHSVGALMPPCPGVDVSLQNQATTLYNAVVHPLAPYGVAGVVWYQGESNAGNPAPYATLLRRLIGSWRQLWQQAELPVVVVQLANYMAPSAQPQQSSWALLREAQRTVARELPAVELATAIDLGETVDIHPLRKQELATRIGDAFARMVYRDKRAPLSPQPTTATAQGSTVTLAFAEALEEGSLNEFELAGADGKYHNAVATAKGSTVTVTADGVEKPCFVRHAWKDNPINLNARAAKSGLPVTPFQLQVGQ